MKAAVLVVFATLAMVSPAAAQDPSGPGTVAEVRIHGNHTTPDADITALVGDVVGKPATPQLIAEIKARIDKSGRFSDVQVLKRYRSIDNLDDILIMVIVDEKPGVSSIDLTPGPWKRFTASGMFMPILHYDDGYGFTYGARIAFVDLLGKGSRVSVPLTWGGERQARGQVDWTFGGGRISADAGIGRKENPHYEIGDTRTGGHVRAEESWRRFIRFGGGGGVEDVRFGDLHDHLTRGGADVAFDTRVDPAFPRNAVYTAFSFEHLSFDAGTATKRKVDLNGYVGVIGQTVLAVRGLAITSKDPLPVYEQTLLGGPSSLRGFDTGYQANDNLAAASVELRIPLSSPMSIGRLGLKLFTDFGASYAAGQAMKDQVFHTGYGGGVYLHLAILSLSLDVAHGDNGDTHAQFGMGITFK